MEIDRKQVKRLSEELLKLILENVHPSGELDEASFLLNLSFKEEDGSLKIKKIVAKPISDVQKLDQVVVDEQFLKDLQGS